MTKEAIKPVLDIEGPLHVVCKCPACKQAQQDEPVAWMSEDEHEVYTSKQVDGYFQHDHIPLYTTPQQRTWVGLTGETILCAAQSSLSPEQYDHFEAMAEYQPEIYDRLAKAIKSQLKEQI
jgi:hypothetical protein